jgi:hypothetical protein
MEVFLRTMRTGGAELCFQGGGSKRHSDYARSTKEDILDNRSNVAERLGYLGRVAHGANPRDWLNRIKQHVGAPPDFAQP